MMKYILTTTCVMALLTPPAVHAIDQSEVMINQLLNPDSSTAQWERGLSEAGAMDQSQVMISRWLNPGLTSEGLMEITSVEGINETLANQPTAATLPERTVESDGMIGRLKDPSL